MKKSLKLGAILTCILAGLVSPTYAKQYYPGPETETEMQYCLDLQGDFSDNEIKKIEDVLDKVDKKIDRKEKRIEYFTIKKANRKETGGNFAIDVFGNTDLSNKTIRIRSDHWWDFDFKQVLSHEMGHIVYDQLLKRNRQLFYEPWKNVFKYPTKKTFGLTGFVSPYASTSHEEDFAETFGKWINNENYNPKNKILKEKINFLKEFVGKKYYKPEFSNYIKK